MKSLLVTALALLFDLLACYLPHFHTLFSPEALGGRDLYAGHFRADHHYWSVLPLLPDSWGPQVVFGVWVASAVGRLSVRIFGLDLKPGRDLAHHLGRALQLTNILRDLDEDAAVGRLYLPREALREAGIDTTDPATALSSPARWSLRGRTTVDNWRALARERAKQSASLGNTPRRFMPVSTLSCTGTSFLRDFSAAAS